VISTQRRGDAEKTKRVEIVEQVKLTPNQKIALMAASNAGGKMQSRCDYDVRVTLTHLRLIEERDGLTPKEKAEALVRIAGLWGDLVKAARARDSREAESKLSKLRDQERLLGEKAYWLTKAADEYLAKGRVVIGEAK
jgi:hypothetical protein